MNREQIEQKVKKGIASQLEINVKKVPSEAHIGYIPVAALGADSLDMIELIMMAEEEFNIEIPDEEAERIKTVEDAVDYIVERVGAGL